MLNISMYFLIKNKMYFIPKLNQYLDYYHQYSIFFYKELSFFIQLYQHLKLLHHQNFLEKIQNFDLYLQMNYLP